MTGRYAIAVLIRRAAREAESAVLIDLARRLAADDAATLHIVRLAAPGEPGVAQAGAQTAGAADVHDTPATPATPGAGPVHAWLAHHPEGDRDDDAAATAQLFQEALAMLGEAGPPVRIGLLATGPMSEDIAAALAAAQAGASLGRCDDLWLEDGALHARKAAFGGRVDAVLRAPAGFVCATVQTAGAGVQARVPQPAPRALALAAVLPERRRSQEVAAHDTTPRLEGARAVVSGGRGMGGAEGFALLEQVAQRLGAALGGSLPAVDAGWLPVARQVGQSGKFVAPRVYLAVGVSGTLQHLAGIAPSTAIVAINSDPQAPIFRVAQVGLVADWRDALPALSGALAAPREAV